MKAAGTLRFTCSPFLPEVRSQRLPRKQEFCEKAALKLLAFASDARGKVKEKEAKLPAAIYIQTREERPTQGLKREGLLSALGGSETRLPRYYTF